MIDGVLNVYKPAGITSFGVIHRLRRILNTKKIGHTGTLDPDVTGVLLVCVGKATKIVEYIMGQRKTYRAEITLGVSTDTQDSSGKIISTNSISATESDVINAIKKFIGIYNQVPPMFSAVRVDGERLYDLARKGIKIERKPRRIEIYSINIEIVDLPKVVFYVECSKGTYIRTLCADIGDRLGCGAHMSYLTRTKVGNVDISNSLTLEQVQVAVEEGKICDVITSIDDTLCGFSSVLLNAEQSNKFLNGVFINPYESGIKTICENNNELIKVYREDNVLIGLGELIRRRGSSENSDNNLFLKSRKQFY